MKDKKSLMVIGIAILAIVLSGTFVWFHNTRTKEASTAVASSLSPSEQTILTLKNRIATEPNTVSLSIGLADAYLQRIRETGDVSLYVAIEKVLDAVAVNNPGNDEILAKRAEVANGRHDFKKGYEFITEALVKNGNTAGYYGIKSDSEIELGKYDDALATLQKMVDIKPNFSSFSRVAYQRELHGDSEGALEALAAAISSGSVHNENVAWALVESGKLHLRTDVNEAERDFNQALGAYPNYAPAFEGLARVAYAQGKKDIAEQRYVAAFKTLPLAQFATALGNFYGSEGDTTKSSQYYALADIAYKNSRGTNVDLEYSLFLSDHGDKQEALSRAVSAYTARPSVLGADAYAWALFTNNRIAEAETYILEALRLGENDPQIVFHAGMIAEALGKKDVTLAYFKQAHELDQYASVYYSSILATKLK